LQTGKHFRRHALRRQMQDRQQEYGRKPAHDSIIEQARNQAAVGDLANALPRDREFGA
jgi:hypothetical protein